MKKNLFILFYLVILIAQDSKNILEFDSNRELIQYMKSISKDLNVKCNYCHDLNDKSFETEKKIIARQMIQMQNDLNLIFIEEILDTSKTQKKSPITCWTCHRGDPIPEQSKPID
tara:strand:- start:9 stop:353 length:345 start_codon:yes stop_codon:yes gene_type:complete